MRNIKMLGLLAVSAMALVAFVGTTAASATSTFTAGATGEQLSTSTIVNHAFFVTEQEVVCGVIKFAGETKALSAETQTVQPTYEECTLGESSLKATVKTNNCSYTFNAATEGEHATVYLDCPEETKGIQIEVSVPFFAKCLIDVPEQSVKKAVHYDNTTPEGDPMDLDVTITATGIMSDVTTSTGLCPLTPGTHEDGVYNGKSTVTAASGVTWSA